MPAPQQSTVPVYKDTAPIPRPNVARHEFSARNSGAAGLANLLGVIPKALKKHQEKQQPSKMEREQLAALATMGAERERLSLAGGRTQFGLMNDPDSSMDAYEINRGRREADSYAGQLRDAYAASGLAENDDPAAFEKFVEEQKALLFGEKLLDVDPSYQHGFLTRLAPVFDDMAKAHAGHLDTFIPQKNKTAMQERLRQKASLELMVTREKTATDLLLDTISTDESGGNPNAYYGNTKNQKIRFTEMTISEVLAWQDRFVANGSPSSAVGRYQFVRGTLRETVRAAGIDPKTTKFTPEVQATLALTRMFTTRKLQDFLDGKMSAETLLNNHLSLEWAGLKKTSGKGNYDGDGLNQARTPAKKTIAALLAFRDHYIKDPRKVVDEKGKVLFASANTDQPQISVADDIANAEVEYGVPQTEARTAAADGLIKFLEENPGQVAREDLPDVMANWKLPQAERERVLKARDSLLREAAQKEETERRLKALETQHLAEDFLHTDNFDSLSTLRTQDPELHSSILDFRASPPELDEALDEEVTASIDPENPEAPQEALTAMLEGQISETSYKSVVEASKYMQKANRYLSNPVLKPMLAKLQEPLNPKNQKVFRLQLATTIADLTEEGNGANPSLKVLVAEAKDLQALLLSEEQYAAQSIMDKYN